jgi:hypothetical protein
MKGDTCENIYEMLFWIEVFYGKLLLISGLFRR